MQILRYTLVIPRANGVNREDFTMQIDTACYLLSLLLSLMLLMLTIALRVNGAI